LQAASSTVTDPVFSWYTDAQLTDKVFTGASYEVSPTATTTYYVTVQGSGTRENAPGTAQTVNVTVNPQATANDLSVEGGGTICTGETVTQQAASPTARDEVLSCHTDAKLTNKVFTGASYEVSHTAT